jgi:hypothetical protein
MNRRQFTRGLATFGLAPVLPIPSFGSTSAGTAVAAATAEKMYFMGWYTARMRATCSPEMLVKELNVKADVANQIFNKLVETQTVSPPNALGISRTIDPLAKSYKRVARSFGKQMASEQSHTPPQENILERDRLPFDEDAVEDDQSDVDQAAHQEHLDDVELSTLDASDSETRDAG